MKMKDIGPRGEGVDDPGAPGSSNDFCFSNEAVWSSMRLYIKGACMHTCETLFFSIRMSVVGVDQRSTQNEYVCIPICR